MEQNLTKTNINWYPGHMAKAKREMKEKMPLVDLIYEVIDARMPLSSKVADIDEVIKGKPRILIMTKYDMCDQKITDEIIDFYRQKGYTVIPVDLINNKNIAAIIDETNKISKKINIEREKKGLKPRNIRALVVGAPNVGKSTLINQLVGKKVAATGDRPGVTKNLGWIRIGKNIELLDSPGILWPKLDNQEYAHNLAALSSIREEIVDSQELSIYILTLLSHLYPTNLNGRYGFSKLDDDIYKNLDIIGNLRKTYIKGGEIDYEKVYQIIIRDLRGGFLGKITLDRLK